MTPSTLLFGATSILGFNLACSFPHRLLPFVSPGSRAPSLRRWPALQLEDCSWIETQLQRHEPDTLIYCHAVCDVPKCEAAPEWAYAINVQHVRRLLAALPAGMRLIYVSSDHVFGGDGIYDEGVSPCPISVYGRTRVEAENLVLSRNDSLVVRVGLPIGPSPNGRTGHLEWLHYRIQRKLPITIVHDEYRSVVWANDLAHRIMQLTASAESGIRHVTASRAISRVELANYLLSRFNGNAGFARESRHQRTVPHLGRVELRTLFHGPLFDPLSCVLDEPRAFNGCWPTSHPDDDRQYSRAQTRCPRFNYSDFFQQ